MHSRARCRATVILANESASRVKGRPFRCHRHGGHETRDPWHGAPMGAARVEWRTDVPPAEAADRRVLRIIGARAAA